MAYKTFAKILVLRTQAWLEVPPDQTYILRQQKYDFDIYVFGYTCINGQGTGNTFESSVKGKCKTQKK